MKITSIRELKNSGHYEKFQNRFSLEESEMEMDCIIDWIKHKGCCEQSLNGNWLILTYCLNINGVEFITEGKKFMKNLEGREDMLDYITIKKIN